MNEASHAHELIDFVRDISIERMPQAVVEQARVCLLEALGCGAFGSGQPWSRILSDEMVAEGSRGASSLIGRTEKLAAPAAAMCNGTSIHGFELDDLIAESVVHPGAAVIPAALAAAEAVDASGARLIEAIVAGYEVMHRVGLALGAEPSRKGFHVTSLAAPVATAVASGLVMGLSLEQLRSSVGLSCSAASGIKSFAVGKGGGMVKRLHLGRAAEAGVRASQLASRGFFGPAYALDSRFGLIEVFGGGTARPEMLSTGLGSNWAIEKTWFKVFPICGWIQSAVQLLLDLRGPEPLDPRDVKSVRVGVSKYAVQNNSEPAPVDTMGAQYSIPYCAALALTGDPRDPANYAVQAVNRESVRALAKRIEVFVDPRIEAVYPAKYGASVSLVSGNVSVEDVVFDCHGTPEDPCTQEESRTKLRMLTKGKFSERKVLSLAESVGRLESLDSVRQLTGNFQ
ncbi:MmgE/PrpD family protein [Mesorhizobium sp. M7A.F.Ca.US.006.01.1.1]|uniref:MmgE/PrpD family protein n=1 Tax=Mesorhizobium sp. M7A.F.Ca.US.006.01.1.1 TaxID=2496707 RepID=UPI000FCC18C8|nr:MmgE/PrpD family protein [Mesorhizobium sp. M7A.F.Ca.US.006.01.1.1]RUZ71959.1 MmgE/PrpD family protein [Mesorhizobium sp. M7A.F.Ca.US.006.01.1.1]